MLSDDKLEVSIVSPVYRAEKLVLQLVQRLVTVLESLGVSFEVILVEDSSPDLSWERIKECCSNDSRIRGIRLSRNFGQHQAITAGLSASKGNWIVVMDCDLQDRPEEIPRLLAKGREGFDLVVAQRSLRQDSFWKRASSRLFYGLFSYLTGTRQDSSIANFGIYRRKVIEAVLQMKERGRAFPILVQWVGFKRAELQVEHGGRPEGRSSYTVLKLIALAVDIILSFSTKPLHLVLRFGIGISLLSALVGFVYLYRYLSGGISVPGFASLMISIWFLAGVVIATLGVLGLYLSKIFEQVKERPLYIVDQEFFRGADESSAAGQYSG